MLLAHYLIGCIINSHKLKDVSKYLGVSYPYFWRIYKEKIIPKENYQKKIMDVIPLYAWEIHYNTEKE